MKRAALQKAENKNQLITTSSFKRNADALLAEVHEITYGITTGPAFNFGKINVYDPKSAIRVQPKLTINQPRDKYEQEADAMADKVMRMSDTNSLQDRSLTHGFINIKRKCAECEKRGIERKELAGTVPSITTPIYQPLQSPGKPLDTGVRSFMEKRFGHDFSKVQVHDNQTASQSAKDIDALAYTHENNIVFRQGQYQPETNVGKHLLAHELTHILQQQNSNSVPSIQRLGFFESIGVFLGLAEGDYSDKELKEYLDQITKTDKIEDKYDSDNKARGIVRKWKAGNASFDLTGTQMSLLIREMDSGYVGDADQNAIFDLLERCSNGDLRIIFSAGGINPVTLSKHFSDVKKKKLELFFDTRFDGGMAAILSGKVEPIGALPKAKPDFPYNWNAFSAKLRGPYTIEEIKADINALSSDNRDKALKDMGVDLISNNRKLNDLKDKLGAESDPVKKDALKEQGKLVVAAIKKTEAIIQPSFKDIAIAETPATLSSKTRIPTAAEKVEIAKALKPDLRTSPAGVALPFEEKLPGEAKDYEDKLRDFAPTMISDYYSVMVVNKGPAEHSDPSKVHDLKEFEKIGNESKKETDKVFGNYKTGPVLKADVPAVGRRRAVRGNIHDLWQDMQKDLGRMTAGQRRSLAKALVFYFFQSNDTVLDLNSKHNADPKFSAASIPLNTEAKMQDKIADEQIATAAQIKKLNEIDRGWDASAGGGEINLQIFKKDTPDEDRDFLWDMFQTLIHEYLHTLAHSNYNRFAESFGNTSNQFNTLVEGVDSLLDEIVWSNVESRVNDPVLRAQIEGPAYAGLPPIKVLHPSRRRYASYTQAIKLVNIVGIRNLYAAYFLGDVDKIKT